MLYFTLPYFHQFDNKLPNILFKLSIEQEDKFITPVHFFSKYNNFPYCYLNGGFNFNNGTFYRYHQLESNANYKNGGVKRINLSNINFNEFDINDEYLNTILTLYNTGSNFIDIPNEQIGQAILDKGYIYDLVVKLINSDLDIQDINSLTSLDYINLVSLPMGFTTNLDLLRKLLNRNKIELTVNSVCHKCNKINHESCLLEEHKLIYNYSNYSYIQDCINQDNYKNSTILSLSDIVNNYTNLGFKFFRLDDLPINFNINDFIYFFINYFIKPEYRLEILEFIESEVFDD